MSVIDLSEKFALFDDQWAPRIVGRINDMDVKVAKVRGEFIWHSHDDTDEFFLVHRGRLTIQLDGQEDVTLEEGQFFVVPRGVQHRPVATEECQIVLLEPSGVVNTGDAGGDLTAASDEWV